MKQQKLVFLNFQKYSREYLDLPNNRVKRLVNVIKAGLLNTPASFFIYLLTCWLPNNYVIFFLSTVFTFGFVKSMK